MAIHGSCPNWMVSQATPTTANATETHCARLRRSRRKATPSKTFNSGLMKYPRLLSTTWPALTAQIYRAQFEPISRLLSASIHAARGRASAVRNQPRPCVHNSQATTSKVLQTTRWATICSDGTTFRKCQYRGISPHSTNEAMANQRPWRASRWAGLMPSPWRG